jgi:HAD superfamily hydrolase (TIGR01450 family)
MDDSPSPADAPVAGADPDRIDTVLCDLDGVIWLAHEPVPGSADAVARLRASGRRVLFVTNNSADTEADQVAALAAVGIAAAGDVVTSAMAAAALVDAGEQVLVVGGPGIAEAVAGAGAVPHRGGEVGEATPFDVVIVGLDREFDFRRLRLASGAVRRGARLLATNSDATFPTPHGPEPGGGAIVAAVATAAGATPVVAGKPHRPMADLIGRLLGGPAGFDPSTVLMVGDRPETDGRFAAALGCPYALVRSGVVAPGVPVGDDVEVAIDVPDLARLAAHLAPSGASSG